MRKSTGPNSSGEETRVSISGLSCMVDSFIIQGQKTGGYKGLKENLRRTRASLRSAQRLACVGIWEWNLITNSFTSSDEVYKIYGLEAAEIKPGYGTFIAAVHPDYRSRAERSARDALEGLAPFDLEHRIIRPDGTERVVHETWEVDFDDSSKAVRIAGAVQDITRQKQVEEQLVSSNQELRALSSRIQSVREEESIRIARKIHDELGGALTSLKMDIWSIDKTLTQLKTEEIREKLSSISGLIDHTVQKVRDISTELRPSVLDDLGLAAAIEWQTNDFQRRIAVKCKLSLLHGELAISRDKSTAVFRIFQEILTNVARHADG